MSRALLSLGARRQVFYRLVSLALVEKTEKAAQRISGIMVEMRRREEIGYGDVRDGGRRLSRPFFDLERSPTCSPRRL